MAAAQATGGVGIGPQDLTHNLGVIEPNSAQDLANKAFEAFTKGQFKETQKFLDKIQAPQGAQEKDTKVQMNSLLTDYFMNRGRNPQKLLTELINLAQDMVDITKAPLCSIKPLSDGTQTQMIQLGNVYQGPLNPVGTASTTSGGNTISSTTSPEGHHQQQQMMQGASTGVASGSGSHRSASQNPKTNQGGAGSSTANTGYGGVSDIVPSQNSIFAGAAVDGTNTILLYNIAAMSYQMQQYGQAMTYLIELMKKLDLAEEFIVLKSMFLLLQILFELKQSSSAWPVISFIEIKLKEADKILQQKQSLKSQPPEPSQDGSSQEETKNSSGAAQDQYLLNETLDETVLIKNSFSIINASYIRKHAVSPKNMNIHEYRILLSSYKAMFLLIQNDITQAHQEIKVATELRAKINQDPVKIKQCINEPACIQHQGLVNNIKALIHLGQGNIMKSIKNLSFDEKDYPKVHPSCYHQKHTDDHSKHDQAYQKCLSNHPQYYFNNLGVVHLKLQKFNLAIFYFSKALKFLEKSQNGQPQQPYDPKDNPGEYISNLSSQKTPEILYNYGLALFKSQRYEEAFRCFEKSSATLKHHPRLWYYMGLSVLNLNMKKQQELLKDHYQSDVFHQMVSWGNPNYTKILTNNQHRRFLLTMQGDPLSKLRDHMGTYEQQQIDRLKQQQMEILKQQQAQSTQKQSKAQQKKEKLAQQAKQSVIPLDSMSLQGAIMYFQNALIAIETAKSNEINYGIYIKFILRQQMINAQQSQSDNRNVMTIGLLPQTQNLSDSLNDSTDTQSFQGFEEGTTSQIFDFPQNQAELNTFKQQIAEKFEKKFLILKKNVNLHLCYLYLMTYDYINVIKTGNGILRNLNPNAKTRFQVLQYLAEAYCMLGQGSQAMECLKADHQLDNNTMMRFDNLANGLKEANPVSVKTISLLNQSAVHMCQGSLEQAKQCFDQVLDSMDLKLQTVDSESKQLIPSYLINLLVYFYIKTKNYKMARQLLKSRRFLLDTNHIEAVNQGTISQAQRARNQSKTLIKSFL